MPSPAAGLLQGQHKPVPRWLRETAARLGTPEIDTTKDGARRWLWEDGEVGVVISQTAAAWQVVAFGPSRSITLRAIEEPTERTVKTAVELADLCGWDRPVSAANVAEFLEGA